ncbi:MULTISPECIES: hypothetical protein [Aquimarina]|uniref:DUF3592 domain-containing protein n=1 Tax=Aquimarina algiphila TaxID=2047982 RepID=A0A554VMZ2_9FLAO|nr:MULTISPECIES: hypothetical protein [Aquimarina]TSE09729.1 hypothetical protein FOF46_06865 [Aquimarina algiphila]
MNKKFIGLLTVLLISISALALNTHFKKKKLNANGVIATAVIEKITSNKYENEIGTPVDNIHITYKYIVHTKEIVKTQEILRHEHDQYFETNTVVGDSISIKYDTKNPSNSRIEKIAQLSN